MTFRSLSLVPLLVALLVAACTDSAVNSSSGTGSGASNGHGTAATGGSSATAGTMLSLCDKFCAATGSCFEDCHAACEAFQAPPCEKEGTSLVTCMSANYDAATCATIGNACENEYPAFASCRASAPANCAAPVCGASSLSCACTSQCDGGDHKVICDLHPDGTSECSCVLNGLTVASCGQLPTNGPTVSVCTNVMTMCCADYGFGHS